MTPAGLVDSVPIRLGAFVVVLLIAFGAAFGVGSAVGPTDDTGPVTTTAPGREHPGPHDEEHGS